MKWYAFAILSLAACGEAGQEPQAPAVAEQAQHVASAHTFYGGYEAIGATGEGYWGLYGKGTVGQGVVGKGGPGVAGGYFEAGTLSTAAARYAALQVVGGDVALAGPPPAPAIPVSNSITPTSMAKAWASVQIQSTGSSTPLFQVHDGMNVAGVTSAGTAIYLDFAAPFSSQHYACHLTADRTFVPIIGSKSPARLSVLMYDMERGMFPEIKSINVGVDVVCFGRQ